MASSVSQSAQYSHNIQHSSSFDQSDGGKPKHVFSDDELSEIFQIDFGQIFGNPDSGRKNNYKGIQIKKSAQGNSRVWVSACIISFIYFTNNLLQLFFQLEFISLLLLLHLHIGHWNA